MVLLLLTVSVSCSQSKSNDFVKELNDNQFFIDFENANMEYIYGLGTAIHYLEFELISPIELSQKNIKIKDFDDSLYQIELIDLEKGPIANYILYNYLEIDWKKMYELELKSDTPEGLREFSEYVEKYNSDMDELNSDIAPNSYYYLVSISLESDIIDHGFNILTIDSGEEVHEFDLGSISFSKLEEDNKLEISNVLELTTLAASGMTIIPNSGGYIQTEVINFKTNDDIEVISVKSLAENTKVVETQFTLTKNDDSKNILFTDNPLLIEKDTMGQLHVLIQDENFKKQLNYATVIYLEITYKDSNHKEYSGIYNASVQTRLDYSELIAVKRDKMDFTSFYYDYYSKLTYGY